MTTRAPSADGANLGHHAEPTLGEDLCAGTVGSAVQSQPDGCQGRVSAGGCGIGRLHEVRVCLRGLRGGRQTSGVWMAE